MPNELRSDGFLSKKLAPNGNKLTLGGGQQASHECRSSVESSVGPKGAPVKEQELAARRMAERHEPPLKDSKGEADIALAFPIYIRNIRKYEIVNGEVIGWHLLYGEGCRATYAAPAD
jgi:hypothetical protein